MDDSPFDFSELEKLHKETFEQAIDILVNHFDTYVQDEKQKQKALIEIKKEVEQMTKVFRRKNDDSI